METAHFSEFVPNLVKTCLCFSLSVTEEDFKPSLDRVSLLEFMIYSSTS